MADASKKQESRKKSPGKPESFSEDERAAMQAAKAERRKGKANGEDDVLAAFAKMGDADRKLGEAIHALVKAHAPGLAPKTWYGMPAYANADGKIVCFFQDAGKFKARYSTLGFNDAARLDDGKFWPTAYALTSIGPAEEKQIAALIKQAAG
jgi:uncharacterized protein YdhG (YjbR/CyaY superfamily)